MARRTRRPAPTVEHTLAPTTTTCVAGGRHVYPDYSNFRTVTTLTGVVAHESGSS
ncbi:hypothetical protein VT84_22150 [Gemmata sp. SH-PL17]|uniref:hypothetical protein n=1 Tax=Gemmata sp. SH-PL17 TaxID=1630693 RepID=UPI00078C9463|nr:hypothetical protein [Gemmata sp. SH-PL17]AMV27120.1 hypothetical protein VT84_22150 [Gemmata sp. SH-PL17]